MSKSTMLVDAKIGYTRKVNMHEHGGLQYEMAEITQGFIAKDITLDEAPAISAALYKKCVAVVEKRIERIDKQAKEKETTPTEKTGIELDKEEMDDIIEVFNDITIAKSMKALRNCAQEVKELAPSLKKVQIKFLRAHYKDRLRTLKQ